ncbi:hypothetical protein NDU88_000720 [Pleurodeles waltl]|uniref:Uncharacterized protein n=1 Tax=Pleurodeles waltl TaxID=8319 RepID=A0AAV7KMS2_PLEWA|nr:hypothetical protein NDU88_000720 [Pleurodeles waltl]
MVVTQTTLLLWKSLGTHTSLFKRTARRPVANPTSTLLSAGVTPPPEVHRPPDSVIDGWRVCWAGDGLSCTPPRRRLLAPGLSADCSLGSPLQLRWTCLLRGWKPGGAKLRGPLSTPFFPSHKRTLPQFETGGVRGLSQPRLLFRKSGIWGFHSPPFGQGRKASLESLRPNPRFVPFGRLWWFEGFPPASLCQFSELGIL